ncbi:hypothetical protein V491_06122 [Pseudogymnoascus sp. VKM F-3775]|nr:hypothetical protein V491_06122 [Pseudogymnoascus sp. VKM F-3775]
MANSDAAAGDAGGIDEPTQYQIRKRTGGGAWKAKSPARFAKWTKGGATVWAWVQKAWGARDEEYTGPKEVLRQDHMKDEALGRYQQGLEAMVLPILQVEGTEI